ncbi:hypothetical protein K438DRAFT_1989806 [Mycena galopus ATCC 62051]|nr:hypothetical protein K438DRAFT_1989802 [Mycena galopus ATCC 62051]KAF8147225.1 hypothetical protein K438DRAFT_1989806 [Mycena galopus ATCC 62051]
MLHRRPASASATHLMPIPRRTSSNTTHVSDSEPEREARRRNEAQSSSPPDSPPPQRTPLSSISNTLLGTEPIRRPTIETRLSKLEGEIAEIEYDLNVLRHEKRNRTPPSPPSTPLPKRRRTMHGNTATAETPILRSSLMASTPERHEMTRIVSEGIQQSLREWHRQNLSASCNPVAPGSSGTRRKLRRRAHEC